MQTKEEIAAYMRNYRAAHKDDLATAKRAYQLAHKDEIAARNKAWREAHKEELADRRRGRNSRPYSPSYYQEHKDEHKAAQARYAAEHPGARSGWSRERNRALKTEVLSAYGGAKCVCCGETLFEGLTIDHIGGDGSAHRKEIGNTLYPWLKKNNYPPGFQVLCGTCNMAKRTSDHCPHEDLRIAWG
jgi:hypothetical protein